ncbi:hypothetical protein HK405_006009, partial [Cladochytrium tenue]
LSRAGTQRGSPVPPEGDLQIPEDDAESSVGSVDDSVLGVGPSSFATTAENLKTLTIGSGSGLQRQIAMLLPSGQVPSVFYKNGIFIAVDEPISYTEKGFTLYRMTVK